MFRVRLFSFAQAVAVLQQPHHALHLFPVLRGRVLFLVELFEPRQHLVTHCERLASYIAERIG